MSTDDPKPPPFYCPACGRKHRADLRSLTAHAGASARVACQRCGATMALSMGADGLPKCEVHPSEDAPGASATATAPSAATPPVSPGGDMSTNRMLPTLAAAAVLAAVVSFLVVTLTRGEPMAARTDDGRVAALEQRLADTERRLVKAVAQAASAGREAIAPVKQTLEERLASLEAGLAAQAQSTATFESMQKESSGAVTELRGKFKTLNGRIETNYTGLNVLKGRVAAIEKR